MYSTAILLFYYALVEQQNVVLVATIWEKQSLDKRVKASLVPQALSSRLGKTINCSKNTRVVCRCMINVCGYVIDPSQLLLHKSISSRLCTILGRGLLCTVSSAAKIKCWMNLGNLRQSTLPKCNHPALYPSL